MKLLLYISALVLIIGCATPVKHSYFTFDEVEYYSIRIAEPEVNALFVREDSLDTDSLRLLAGTLVGGHPKTMNEAKTALMPTEYGYNKQMIPAAYHAAIETIFSEKNTSNNWVAACEPIYRDILIFKQSNKIVGVAKLCFECHQHQILGTSVNTEMFGQDGDWEKLEMLLNHIEN